MSPAPKEIFFPVWRRQKTIVDSVKLRRQARALLAKLPTTREEAQKWKDWDRRLGAGTSKEAWALGKFAVRYHYGHGADETRNYAKASRTTRSFMLPVLAEGAFVQVQLLLKTRRCSIHACPNPSACPISGGDVSDGWKFNHAHLANGDVWLFDYGESTFYGKVKLPRRPRAKATA